jgi:hypothetical protein
MLGKLCFTNKTVAKQLNVDEKRVSAIMDFVFAELGKEIKECKRPYIYVKGLGTFILKITTIERRLRTQLRMYRMYSLKDPAAKSGNNTVKAHMDGTKKEIFESFRIRRVIKTRIKENKKLKYALKAIHDTKGEPIQISGKESGPVQEA